MNPNNYEKQKARGLKRKWECIQSRGGKCEICGYDKNISALEFHHKDPNEKDFQLDIRHFSNHTISKLKSELDKCILVCANCHREIHNPQLTKDNITSVIQNTTTNSFKDSFGSECPVCGKRFPKMKGKKYCSKECRDKALGIDKYPSKSDVENKYKELKSWQKVADFYQVTRRIIQTIRKQ